MLEDMQRMIPEMVKGLDPQEIMMFQNSVTIIDYALSGSIAGKCAAGSSIQRVQVTMQVPNQAPITQTVNSTGRWEAKNR